MKLKSVGEQVVAVMGASSGIGRETALRFAKSGTKVVVAARSEAGLRSLEDEIGELGGEVTTMVAHVYEFDQVEAVAQSTVEEYGRLDTWMHLAAVGLFAPFEQTQPEEFRRVVDVDLMGQVYGTLVHISSVVGNARRPYRAPTAPLSTASTASWRVVACRAPARGLEQHRRHQCHAGGQQHAVLRQGSH